MGVSSSYNSGAKVSRFLPI